LADSDHRLGFEMDKLIYFCININYLHSIKTNMGPQPENRKYGQMISDRHHFYQKMMSILQNMKAAEMRQPSNVNAVYSCDKIVTIPQRQPNSPSGALPGQTVHSKVEIA